MPTRPQYLKIRWEAEAEGEWIPNRKLPLCDSGVNGVTVFISINPGNGVFKNRVLSKEYSVWETLDFFPSSRDLDYVLRLSGLSSFQMRHHLTEHLKGAALKDVLSLTRSLSEFLLKLFSFY